MDYTQAAKQISENLQGFLDATLQETCKEKRAILEGLASTALTSLHTAMIYPVGGERIQAVRLVMEILGVIKGGSQGTVVASLLKAGVK